MSLVSWQIIVIVVDRVGKVHPWIVVWVGDDRDLRTRDRGRGGVPATSGPGVARGRRDTDCGHGCVR